MRTFIIAEAGVNHNGSLELELSESDQTELYFYCQDKKIQFLSSPFDLGSMNFLCQTLKLPVIKIASGEITNLPLLLRVSRSNISIILSTGMCSLGEIETALAILAFGYTYSSEEINPFDISYKEIYYSENGQKILQEKVSLLHCTSEYPAPFAEANLRAMQTLRNCFLLPIGYSDHTMGIAVAIAAVACGAEIIEKHFTIDKSLPGPDHQASLNPQELATMIQHIRQVELALGNSKKIPTTSELKNRFIARKSLVSLKKIKKGDLLNEENMGCKRPGGGISPTKFYEYKNKRAERDYEKDDLIGM